MVNKMSKNQLHEKIRKLKKRVDEESVVSNWVEFVKFAEDHPDEVPRMTPRFRKWMEDIGAGI